jgi:hypothetical protein
MQSRLHAKLHVEVACNSQVESQVKFLIRVKLTCKHLLIKAPFPLLYTPIYSELDPLFHILVMQRKGKGDRAVKEVRTAVYISSERQSAVLCISAVRDSVVLCISAVKDTVLCVSAVRDSLYCCTYIKNREQ